MTEPLNPFTATVHETDNAQLDLDFDSDEPLPACPLRNNGDEICESCQ